jgi:hypothetical protein
MIQCKGAVTQLPDNHLKVRYLQYLRAVQRKAGIKAATRQ